MSAVIKCHRELDRYVLWSTVCDAPTLHGDQQKVAEYLLRYENRDDPTEVRARLTRADLTGTSTLYGLFAWDDDSLIVEQRGLLPREKLWAFCEAYFGGPDRRDEWLDMLEPFDDDDDECVDDPCLGRAVFRG